MTYQTHTTNTGNIIEIDCAQASAPIYWVDGGERCATVYQTADASHGAEEACQIVDDWLEMQSS